jgi:hypothetical protein
MHTGISSKRTKAPPSEVPADLAGNRSAITTQKSGACKVAPCIVFAIDYGVDNGQCSQIERDCPFGGVFTDQGNETVCHKYAYVCVSGSLPVRCIRSYSGKLMRKYPMQSEPTCSIVRAPMAAEQDADHSHLARISFAAPGDLLI